MTPQESELISTLLTRLKGAAGQPKDPEAEAMIRQAAAAQPDAPYYLVQTVLIQDLSLTNAQKRIAALEQQVADGQAPKPATSFLGGLFGHSQPAQPPASVPATSPGPWSRAPQTVAPPPGYGAQPGYAPQPGYAQPAAGGMLGGGGGFLRSAAATAAGVAGGAMLFEGISSLFGHHEMNGIMGNQGGMMPGLGETVVNNYYGDGGPGQDAGGGQDYGAGPDMGGQDSSGGDFGGGQDYGTDPGSDDSDQSGGDFGSDDSSGGDFGGGDNSSC